MSALTGDARYGVSVSTFVNGRMGMDREMRLISGPRVVVEDVVRSWLTPRGSLITNPNRGVDVREWLGSSMPANGDYAKKHALEVEALADDRVDQIEVNLTYDKASETLSIAALIQLADAAGPFEFVVQVTALTVTLVLPKAA